jgi:hypothetical protein
MTRLRHLAALTLALALTLAAAVRDARAGQHVGHLEPGLLVARGFEAIDVKPTVGGDLTTWWSPSRPVGYADMRAASSLAASTKRRRAGELFARLGK